MARKKRLEQEVKKNPMLTVPRSEAEERIKIQIDKGNELKNRSIGSLSELENANSEKSRWKSYVVELLSRYFDNNSISEAFYEAANRPFMIIGEYTLGDQIKEFQTDMTYYLIELESLYGRLELIPEKLPVSVPATLTANVNTNNSRQLDYVQNNNTKGKQVGLMKKKLQVFVSSTFTDMQEERWAAIEEILNAGHIPAGMEIFKAGSVTQKEIIKRTIEECDAYCLILGSRYGSIDPETDISYTHWEYNYAAEKNMPRFAIIMHDELIELKVREHGMSVIDYLDRRKAFKSEVEKHISAYFKNTDQLKLHIKGSLQQIEQDYPDLPGWISGRDVKKNISDPETANEIERLKSQINQYELEKAKEKSTKLTELLGVQVSNSIDEELPKEYLKFLVALYDAVEGRKHSSVNMWELGEKLGFNRSEVSKIVDYISDEGYIDHMGLGGGIGITHQGVKYIGKIKSQRPKITPIEKEILKRIFEKDFKMGGVPTINHFSSFLTETNTFEKTKELAYYINKLERTGLIEFTDEPFLNGGQTHAKYNNRAADIWFDRIFITAKGETMVQD